MNNLRRVQVSDEITIYSNLKNNSNVVAFERAEGLVLIDTFLFPKHNTELFDRVVPTDKNREIILINTHSHSDHCYGNKVFQDVGATVISHKLFEQTISSEKRMILAGKTYKSLPRRVPSPDITFDGSLALPHYDLELLHTPGHTLDSITVYSTNDKILVTGDNTLGSYDDYFVLPYIYWGGLLELKESLEKILTLEVETVIPGHGAPLGKDKLEQDLFYLNTLQNKFSSIKELLNQDSIRNLVFSQETSFFNDDFLGDLIEKHLSIESCLCPTVHQKIGIQEIHSLNIKRLILNFYSNYKEE